MKTTHRLLLSIAASIGAAILIISVLSIVNVFESSREGTGIWDSYMESFYHYLHLMPYLVIGSFICFLLFYILKIKRRAPVN